MFLNMYQEEERVKTTIASGLKTLKVNEPVRNNLTLEEVWLSYPSV